MKIRYYILIELVCFGGILYYFVSDMVVEFPWLLNITLFVIGEISFAMGIGKFMKRNREIQDLLLENENF